MQPLHNVRVLDLTRHLPGPWATMTLGDFGAQVIKVERPLRGDTVRAARPRYGKGDASESVYFCNVNRNKSSIELDFKDDADRARFLDLVETADVVVENFRAGTADRLGIGYEASSDGGRLSSIARSPATASAGRSHGCRATTSTSRASRACCSSIPMRRRACRSC